MTDCKQQLNELTHTSEQILDRDIAALRRIPEETRIEKYNQLKSDEDELRWEFGQECPNFLTDGEQSHFLGEIMLARLLLAASFHTDSDVPAAMADDFIEAELQAVLDFHRFKQFDALDEDQIEERIRRMEGEVYELVKEYTSTQLAKIDELMENPDVQQDVIERLVDRYEERRERIRQGFFVYVETHGLEHMVASIEDAVEAVSESTVERERIESSLNDELRDIDTTLDEHFEQPRRKIEAELSRVQRRVASQSADTTDIKATIDSIDPLEEGVLDELTETITQTEEFESALSDKIAELETVQEEADTSDETGEDAVEVVAGELDRLTEQRNRLQTELDRLEAEREEVEHARESLEQRKQSLTDRVETIDSAVDDDSEAGIDGADVVSASTARLFEMDYLGRFDTTMHEAATLALPDEVFEVPEDYWDGRSERRNEASRMTQLLDEYDGGDVSSYPVNPTARYEITESKYLGLSEETQMVIEATVFSHLEPQAMNGFDAVPADVDDLLSFVNDAVESAQGQAVPHLLGIASPTGWSDDVREFVAGHELSRARYSRHVSVCLIDLKNGELIYDDSDSVVTDNIDLFERTVRAETVEDCVSMLRDQYVTALDRDTVMLEEVVAESDFDRHVVKQSFDRLESEGDGEQFYIEEHGLTLDTGL